MSKSKKHWPADCVWPEPSDEGFYWEAEDAESLPHDDAIDDLLEIREYFDELVECGRLNEDYSLNEDYEENEDPGDEDFEEFEPKMGSDYWDDGFDIDFWTEDITAHLNLLKLPLPSPVDDIQRIIGYEFINENLLRQAFTRRSFAIEYGIGDSEKLEFIGDAVLNTVLTREMARQLTEVDVITPAEPFSASYSEGELTVIRSRFVSGEYLAARASLLGLDNFILYGSGDESKEKSKEDMMEALIGAVAVDCNWDWYTLETVADRMLCIQLGNARNLLQKSYYDIFNAWHQRHFGQMPDYEVEKGRPIGMGEYSYYCTLRYFIPQNDKGVRTLQRIDVQRETRSKAREFAAEEAYRFVVNNGLWVNLKDAGIEPRLEDSINQLQELYQKKYVEGSPEYHFEERNNDRWYCSCSCGGVDGWGVGEGKTKAKKKAAFMVLVRLMMSAGICKDEWEKAMWKTLE